MGPRFPGCPRIRTGLSIGFFLSTTLVVTGLAKLFGAELRQAVPAAALLAGVLWATFVVGLDLPLPIGSLWIR